MNTFTIYRSAYNTWNGKLESRVLEFRNALAAHAMTVDQAAPVEHEIVEFLARNSSIAIEIQEDPQSVAPSGRYIETLAFRRRLTAEERAAWTLVAYRALGAGDAMLQVMLDDLNSATTINLDDEFVHEGFTHLVELGVITEERRNAIFR